MMAMTTMMIMRKSIHVTFHVIGIICYSATSMTVCPIAMITNKNNKIVSKILLKLSAVLLKPVLGRFPSAD